MDYKEICNKHITAMAKELLDAGAPLPEVLETANKIMKLVLDIMQLGVEISQNTTTDVFVEYFGHVDQLHIMVFRDGWEKDKEYYSRNVYLNETEHRTEKDIIETLEEIYAELVDIS